VGSLPGGPPERWRKSTRTNPLFSTPQTPTSFGGLQLEGFFVLRSLAMNQKNNSNEGGLSERSIERRKTILGLARKVFFRRALLGPENINSPKFIYINKIENLAGDDSVLFETLKNMAVNEYGLQLRY
jgi:hypothetical protein